MPDDVECLIPSLWTIQQRLGQNQRERSRLRRLFKLALEVREEKSKSEAREPDRAGAPACQAVGS